MENKNNEHQTITFLKSLYQHCDEGSINLRFLHKDKDPAKTVQKFIPLSEIESIPRILKNYTEQYHCYFAVGTRVNGDGSKDGIIQIPALWDDLDLYKLSDKQKDESRLRYRDFPLKPTFVIDSGGGRYPLWMLKEPAPVEEIPKIENLLKRLAAYFHGDMNATDASRILRILGSLNHKYQHLPAVKLIESHRERQYSLDDFDLLPQMEEIPSREERSYREEISEHLAKIMECEFLKHCARDRKTLEEPHWYAAISILARERGGPNFIHSLSKGYPQYSQQETDKKIHHAINDTGPATCERIKTLWDCKKDCGIRSPVVLAGKAKQGESSTHSSPSSYQGPASWPFPLAKKAFYGLPGEFVNLIEPHTESDPAAILVQFLSAVGNVIGPTAHFKVEADTHYLKIFPVLVGETSKGRKGTSTGYIKNIFKQIDPNWRTKSGLSSGEGLIWQVRDEIKKIDPIKEKGRVTGKYQELVIDPGEEDKRLFVIEEEFASILRLIGRDGNILSPIIRRAWDDGNLESLSKNSPAKATGAHISILGHVTRDELIRYLDRTETGNGFANRFIWFCVRRSKALPDGGRFNELNLEPILERLREAIGFGKTVGEMGKSSEAKKIWSEVYPELSEGKPGLLGAVISRAEAQVMRIACIHALLDKSKMVRVEHLEAALALWDYSEESARYIFGDATGNWIADRILRAIKDKPTGLTRTEIRDLFSRHASEDKIDLALSFLENHKLACRVKEVTGDRPVERWVACREGDKSD